MPQVMGSSQIRTKLAGARWSTLRLRLWLVTVAALLLLAPAACRKNAPPGSKQSAANDESATVGPKLPPLTLRDDTPNLMLTWADQQGEFHVVQQITEVPSEGRELVRVVIVGQEAGTGQDVYVANLREKTTEGSYPVHVLPRAEWDRVGAERRKVRLEALAPKAPEAAAGAANLAPTGKLQAIVYGADWCKPCHQAEDFLRTLGVEVTKKDIETSAAAQAEMKQKLAKVRRSGASIPVIDLMGNILVGFNPEALRHLVQQAKGGDKPRNETL